jgi:hypothetical protein
MGYSEQASELHELLAVNDGDKFSGDGGGFATRGLSLGLLGQGRGPLAQGVRQAMRTPAVRGLGEGRT